MSQLSQEQKFRRIAWMRKVKRWLKKSMIVIIILLAFAVLLSYIFITKPSEPQDIEVHKTLLDRI
jgi:regulatory protein YycI of two-component signal transduction system YycFG